MSSELSLRALVLSKESKRPKLLENEIELCWAQAVDLEFRGETKATKYRRGSLAVTSHRLLWVQSDEENNDDHCWLSLASIRDHKGVNSFFKKTPRLYLKVLRTSSGTVANYAQVQQAKEQAGGAKAEILIEESLTLAFRGSDKSTAFEMFEKKLELALSKEEWKKEETKSLTLGEKLKKKGDDGNSERSVGASAAGIGGLMRKQRENNKHADKSIDVAFKDLSALIDKARDMVSLSSKLKVALEENQKKGEDTEREDKGIEQFLLTLGIASPVTKSTAGSMFHQQLAKQLADFLTVPLQKSHGALALVDVYCIFNRARGIELVSPEDLIEAANLFPSIGIKMRLRRFGSGTLAIQSSEHSDEALCERLVSMTKWGEDGKQLVGVGAGDVAESLVIPLILAREYLLMAESKQILCRDEGPEGLRFFHNFFQDISVSL